MTEPPNATPSSWSFNCFISYQFHIVFFNCSSIGRRRIYIGPPHRPHCSFIANKTANLAVWPMAPNTPAHTRTPPPRCRVWACVCMNPSLSMPKKQRQKCLNWLAAWIWMQLKAALKQSHVHICLWYTHTHARKQTVCVCTFIWCRTI